MTNEILPVCPECGAEVRQIEVMNRWVAVCLADPFGHKPVSDSAPFGGVPRQEPASKATRRFYCHPLQTPAHLKKWMAERYNAVINETTDDEGRVIRHTVLRPKLGVRSTPKKKRASLLDPNFGFGERLMNTYKAERSIDDPSRQGEF